MKLSIDSMMKNPTVPKAAQIAGMLHGSLQALLAAYGFDRETQIWPYGILTMTRADLLDHLNRCPDEAAQYFDRNSRKEPYHEAVLLEFDEGTYRLSICRNHLVEAGFSGGV